MCAGGKGDTGLVTSQPRARGGAEARGRREEQQIAGAQSVEEPPPGPPRDLGAKFPTKFPRPRRLLVGQRSALITHPLPGSQEQRRRRSASPPPPQKSASTYRLCGGSRGAHEEQQQREQAGWGHSSAVQGKRAGEWPPRARGPPYRRWPAPLRPAPASRLPPGIPRESWAPGALRLPAELETPRDPPPLRTYPRSPSSRSPNPIYLTPC